MTFEKILIYEYSQLFVNQITDIFQCHTKILKVHRDMALQPLQWFKAYKIEVAHWSSNIFSNKIASLGSLIPPIPYRHVQHVEIVTLKEFMFKAPLPQGLPSASIHEIKVEPCELWYKYLHEYLNWNALIPNLSSYKNWKFKKKAFYYAI